MEQIDTDALEHILDRSTLSDVLAALDSICYEKAAHLRSNWQDELAGKRWELAGAKVGTLVHAQRIINVS